MEGAYILQSLISFLIFIREHLQDFQLKLNKGNKDTKYIENTECAKTMPSLLHLGEYII